MQIDHLTRLWALTGAMAALSVSGPALASNTDVTTLVRFQTFTLDSFRTGTATADLLSSHGLQVNGQHIDLCPNDPTCAKALSNPGSVSVNLGSVSSVSFGYDTNLFPTALANEFTYTSHTSSLPSVPLGGISQDFTLGSFTYTNGQFWLQAHIDFTLQTLSADATLNGKTFSGRIVLTSTAPSTLPAAFDPAANADYFVVANATGNVMATLGSVRVYEQSICPPALTPPCNTGSADLVGHIGSLDLVGFAAPDGGAFVDASVVDAPASTVPEPSAIALAMLGLAGLIGWRQLRHMRHWRPQRNALLMASAALAQTSAHADMTLSILDLQDPFTYGMSGYTQPPTPLGIDNQGRMVGTWGGEGGWLLTLDATGSAVTSAFLPLAPPSGQGGGLVGISLNSGQVLYNNTSTSYPFANDIWRGNLLTYGHGQAADWTRLTTDTFSTNSGGDLARLGAIGTGLANDGRVLFTVPTGGALGIYDQSVLNQVVGPLQPAYGSASGSVVVGNLGVISGVQTLEGANGTRLVNLNPHFTANDPLTKTVLPLGVVATAMNSFQAIVGHDGTDSYLYSPTAGVVNLKTLGAPNAAGLQIKSVVGLNDHGALIGTATNGDIIQMTLQGTLDYIGPDVNGQGPVWRSAWAMDLAPKSTLDFRVLPTLSPFGFTDPQVSFANLGLNNETVHSLQVGDANASIFTPVGPTTLNMSGGHLSTVTSFSINARSALVLSGSNQINTGTGLVNRGDLILQSGHDTTISGGIALGGNSRLTIGSGKLQANIQAELDPTVPLPFFPTEIEVATAASGQAHVLGDVNIGLRGGGRMTVSPGSHLLLDGNLSLAGWPQTFRVSSTDPQTGLPAQTGASVVVNGDVLNNGANVIIEQGTTFKANTFTQTGYTVLGLPPTPDTGKLVVDGTLDTGVGITLKIQGGELSGSGIINGDVFFGGGPTQAFFRPGHSPGHFTINGKLTFGANSALELQLERQADGTLAWDSITANSMSFEAGSLVHVLIGSGVILDGTQSMPTFLACASGCSFDSSVSLVVDGAPPGASISLGANGVVLTATTVPEPGSAALCGVGLLTLAALHRRRRALVTETICA